MNDRTPDSSPSSSNPKFQADEPAVAEGRERVRIARGTKQGFAAADVVHAASGDLALDDAICRGIAMLCVEQLEHTFFVSQLAKKHRS